MRYLEKIAVTIAAVVLAYTLFGLVLSYTWNHSVKVILPNTPAINVWNALMLVLTLHIMFGGFDSTISSLKKLNDN